MGKEFMIFQTVIVTLVHEKMIYSMDMVSISSIKERGIKEYSEITNFMAVEFIFTSMEIYSKEIEIKALNLVLASMNSIIAIPV